MNFVTEMNNENVFTNKNEGRWRTTVSAKRVFVKYCELQVLSNSEIVDYQRSEPRSAVTDTVIFAILSALTKTSGIKQDECCAKGVKDCFHCFS